VVEVELVTEVLVVVDFGTVVVVTKAVVDVVFGTVVVVELELVELVELDVVLVELVEVFVVVVVELFKQAIQCETADCWPPLFSGARYVCPITVFS